LKVGARTLTVAPDVPITSVVCAAHVVAAGYEQYAGTPGVVTRLVVR
jgi:hypothetical protein